jgi:hypothetical protein
LKAAQGQIHVPQAFEAEIDHPELSYIVQMRVAMQEGHPVVVVLGTRPRDGGSEASLPRATQVTEDLPQASLVEWSRVATAAMAALWAKGAYAKAFGASEEAPAVEATSLLVATAALRRLRTAPKRRAKRALTPEFLEEVADVYRRAVAQGQYPRPAIAAHWGRPLGTANRWVVEARNAKKLGEAAPRKAGELK